jgi:thiamine biosynthesis lipoprotein
VLVALGGDIATAGDAPAGGWRVVVRDLLDEPGCQVALESGGAVATSSTVSRSWRRGGQSMHHILDPRTAAPADSPWRTVSVAAASCEAANTVSTAAIVRGLDALPWLRELGVPAHLVGRSGKALTLGGWPADATATVPTEQVTA